MKKFLIVLVVLAVIGYFGFQYVMHGGARDVQAEKAEFVVTSKDFKAEFAAKSDEATKKYLNKTIEVSGAVTAVKDSIVTLDESILCTMKTLDKDATVGKTVKVKGRVVGFDDLMGELKLDECNISK